MHERRENLRTLPSYIEPDFVLADPHIFKGHPIQTFGELRRKLHLMVERPGMNSAETFHHGREEWTDGPELGKV